MAERSLLLFFSFLFLTCITRIEGLSNLYYVAEILHAYSVRTGLAPKPSGWNRRSSAVCIKGERLVELLERGSPSACNAVRGSSR